MAFSLRRASSITSANSQDSLEDFLSEVSPGELWSSPDLFWLTVSS